MANKVTDHLPTKEDVSGSVKSGTLMPIIYKSFAQYFPNNDPIIYLLKFFFNQFNLSYNPVLVMIITGLGVDYL